MRPPILQFAVYRQTQWYKTVSENRRSSEHSACCSLIGLDSAAGPSDAPQTVSQPEDSNTVTEFPIINTTSIASMNSIQSEHSIIMLPCACSDEEASFHYPADFCLLQAPGFWCEGPLLWKELALWPC